MWTERTERKAAQIYAYIRERLNQSILIRVFFLKRNAFRLLRICSVTLGGEKVPVCVTFLLRICSVTILGGERVPECV